ncbi:hypothetical protein K505DRAFT_41708 [Melanomma pulvis-pyrius CBS 109.77]|uniref:Anaphase-promoting complex subunit 5 n=1 Tax=Melanomma pulvis-pyrius CBS 109.77 TaxID=1314802 RepID=A0A6A6XB37_9PLEO|nr:hypothetical protein K505DRAFT_41708 [Melanomma pulvis-pyrius CBS 109.77]
MASPRYITPQKISLLVLMYLYLVNDDDPSPATIPVLSFILSHSISWVPSNARRRSSNARSRPSNAVSRPSPRHADASFPIETYIDVLHGYDSDMPGLSLLDVYLKHLWGMDSFHALHNLFENIGNVMLTSRASLTGEELTDFGLITETSPLGLFVRRARLEFNRLQLDDTMKIWSAFLAFRAPTAKWSERLAGIASPGVDINTTNMGLKPGDDLYEVVYGHLAQDVEKSAEVSIDDLERLLEFQLEKLQRLGCRVPDDMKNQLGNMLGSSGVVLRQSHLVKFFDAWKAGVFTTAFDQLHRYYDYAMQTREKIHYQYALLHMAILQADFNCFGEAVAAINETIATARENQDMTCLNFSLSWLSHMSKAYPKQMKGVGYMGMLGSERDGLTFLKSKAKETKMYNLLSATLLNEAKFYMSSGESIPRALECLYQASHLNIKEDIKNHGSHMLLVSTLYSRLGIAHLSSVHTDLFLHCFQAECPIDERIRASCRSALSTIPCGRYEEGLRILKTIDVSAHRSLKFHQYLLLCTGLIKLRRAICWTDWEACKHYISSLRPDSSTDPELSFMLSEAHIDYLIAREYYTDAFDAIEALTVSRKEDSSDILQRISMLLAKAELFRKVGKPARGFSIALRAASVSFKARLMPSLWSAVGLLASILNSLGEFEPAMRLLRAIIPQCLENEDHRLLGTLYSHMGDSYMGLAGTTDISTHRRLMSRLAKMKRGVRFIDKTRECHERTESIEGIRDQYVKKIILCKFHRLPEGADIVAQELAVAWEQGMEKFARH